MTKTKQQQTNGAKKRGRPQHDLSEKLHRGVRKNATKYKGRGSFIHAKAITAAKLNRPRGPDGKKITAEEWEAWFREAINAGEYTVAKDSQYGTPRARAIEAYRAKSKRNADEMFVHEWIEERGKEGRNDTAHLTPGMLEAIVRGKAKGGMSRMDVYVAVLAASSTNGWRILHNGMGTGGSSVTAEQWKDTVMQHALTVGLYTMEELEEIYEKCQVAVQEKRPRAMILGMGWGGASEGFLNLKIPITEVDCNARVYTGKKNGYLAPDVMAYFSEGKDDLVNYMARRACQRRNDFVLVQASPSCKATSPANGLGVSRGVGRGVHGHKPTEEEELHEFMVVAKGLKKWEQEAKASGRKVAWLLEQPQSGSMIQQPEVTGLLGAGLCFNGCAYGLKHKKPYRMWTNIRWTPKDSKMECQACKNGTRHPERVIARKGEKSAPPTLPGYTAEAARNRIPPAIIEHWGSVAMKAIGFQELPEGGYTW